MTACDLKYCAGSLVDELTIDALASDGRGVGRRDGLVFFVADALPGQVVQARVHLARKRLVEAEAVAVLRRSPEERLPACPHAGTGCVESVPGGSVPGGISQAACGGCAWQTLRYERQLFWKERMVRDAFERVGRIAEPPLLPILPSPAEWGYRNKMEFAFAPSGNGLALGLRERASRGIVPVTGCLMQSERSMLLLAAMRDFCAAEGLSAWNPETGKGLCRFLVIRECDTADNGADNATGETTGEAAGVRGKSLVEVIVGPELAGKKAEALGRRIASALRERVAGLGGFVLSRRSARSDVAYGERVLYAEGETGLTMRVGPLSIDMGHDAFFQVNTGAAALLYAEAARMAEPSAMRSLWDVYCGVGSIGLYLLQAGGQLKEAELVGIESMPGGIAMARRNAEALGAAKARFYTGAAEKTLGGLAGRPDVIVVDPPRAGLAEEVTRALLRKAPGRIVYVSCNPATLARDAARLACAYALRSARPVDLFPQTPHVETVALFTPR